MPSFSQFSQETRKLIEVELLDKLVEYFYKKDELDYLGKGNTSVL